MSRSFVFGVEFRLAAVPARDSQPGKREKRGNSAEKKPCVLLAASRVSRLVKSERTKGKEACWLRGLLCNSSPWHRSLAWPRLLCMPRRKSLLATLTCSFLDSLFGRLHSTSSSSSSSSSFLADSPFFKGFLPRTPSAGAEIRNYNGFSRDSPFSWRSNADTRSIDFLFFPFEGELLGDILTLFQRVGLLDVSSWIVMEFI